MERFSFSRSIWQSSIGLPSDLGVSRSFADERRALNRRNKTACGAGLRMMGYGVMGGYSCAPGNGYWTEDIGFIHEQRTRISTTVDQTREAKWALMGAMLDEHACVQSSMDAGYRAMRDLLRKICTTAADVYTQIQTILSQAQRDRLCDDWHRSGQMLR